MSGAGCEKGKLAKSRAAVVSANKDQSEETKTRLSTTTPHICDRKHCTVTNIPRTLELTAGKET